jgi:hypothetical protein
MVLFSHRQGAEKSWEKVDTAVALLSGGNNFAMEFLTTVVEEAQCRKLLSEDYFTVEGTFVGGKGFA